VKFLQLDERVPGRGLDGHKEFLDDWYGRARGPGWMPSKWVEFFEGKEYLPGWTVTVSVRPGGLQGHDLFLLFNAHVQVREGDYRKVGTKVIVNPFEVCNEGQAYRVLDYALLGMHKSIHREGMKAWA